MTDILFGHKKVTTMVIDKSSGNIMLEIEDGGIIWPGSLDNFRFVKPKKIRDIYVNNRDVEVLKNKIVEQISQKLASSGCLSSDIENFGALSMAKYIIKETLDSILTIPRESRVNNE